MTNSDDDDGYEHQPPRHLPISSEDLELLSKGAQVIGLRGQVLDDLPLRYVSLRDRGYAADRRFLLNDLIISQKKYDNLWLNYQNLETSASKAILDLEESRKRVKELEEEIEDIYRDQAGASA